MNHKCTFLIEEEIMFHFQNIYISVFLLNPQVSKFGASPYTLLQIRSYKTQLLFEILGTIKIRFDQILVNL